MITTYTTGPYLLIFIDGSHEEDIVIQDLINSHKLLKKGGLMIIDDVLHAGVRRAMMRFKASHIDKHYSVVQVRDGGSSLETSRYLYGSRIKRSYDNPNSMYCLRKR